ncbi:hypothetical protein BVX95_02335 [archaeon D22]|nr:hypothetical protein BVX95_02335 [archaeon D22]
MRLLITGASSYVGAKIYSDLKDKFEVVGTYNSYKVFDELIKLDITDRKQVMSAVEKIKPDYIIHIAANGHHKWCEEHKDEAKLVNVNSTRYFVEAANKISAKIIYMSSYVLLGHDTFYAKTKQESEESVKDTKAGYVILRPGHIVGYSQNTKNDRQFNRFLKNLVEGAPAVYNNHWRFQPAYLRNISEIIERVIEKNITNKIIPATCSEVKTRYDLAMDILSPFNIKVERDDNKEGFDLIIQDLKILDELNLPKYSYEEMICEIIKEIEKHFNLKTK